MGGLNRFKCLNGDPGAIRTRDPQIRNLMLYPAELRGHKKRWWCGALESAPRGETYVSGREAAIVTKQGFRGSALRRRAISSKHLAVRSKIDIGCNPLKWTNGGHEMPVQRQVEVAMSMRGAD